MYNALLFQLLINFDGRIGFGQLYERRFSLYGGVLSVGRAGLHLTQSICAQ